MVKKRELTQQKMAEKWPETVSRGLIGKALKKKGFTRKKKRINTEKKTIKLERSFGNLSGDMLRKEWCMWMKRA